MKKIFIVYRKEMLDMLRDRRTIISMVIVPLLLFPIMTMGIGSVISSQIEKTQAEIHTIAIRGGEFYPELADYLKNSRVLRIVKVDDYQNAIKEKRINAAIEFSSDAQDTVESGGSASVKVYYDAAEIKSEFARDKIYRLLGEFEDSIAARRLNEIGGDLGLLDPLITESTNLASREKMSGMMLSTFLPYMIIILSMVGAMYPAIDLTAGEKERGTMETILASPASRLEISIGKFLTVFTTSFVTALLSITSLTATTGLGMAGFNQMSATPLAFKVNIFSFLILIVLMIPVACLFSSVLMTLSLFAKSYKEAQSYITPAMFVVILPAMVSFVPGIEFSSRLGFIPIINVSLVAKEILMGEIYWNHIAVVFISTGILAAFAIFVAKKQFEREEVLFRI